MERGIYDVLYQTELTHWWYRVRRTVVRRQLARLHKKTPTPLNILDVGCGTGALLLEMQELDEVTGIDLSPAAVAYCASRGAKHVVSGDATHLPFPDNSFDVIVILDVLEHLEHAEEGAKELFRVLKPGGTAIVTVPALMFLWGITDELGHHYRRYTRPQLTALLQEAGLPVTRASYFNTFLFPAIAALRLFARVFHKGIQSENTFGNDTFINTILYSIFSFEEKILAHVDFPFGVSILVLAQKP